jgi:hypothetical protein
MTFDAALAEQGRIGIGFGSRLNVRKRASPILGGRKHVLRRGQMTGFMQCLHLPPARNHIGKRGRSVVAPLSSGLAVAHVPGADSLRVAGVALLALLGELALQLFLPGAQRGDALIVAGEERLGDGEVGAVEGAVKASAEAAQKAHESAPIWG